MTHRTHASTCLCAQESMYRFGELVTGCKVNFTVLAVVLMCEVSIMHVPYMYSEGHWACTPAVPHTLSLHHHVAYPSLSGPSSSHTQAPLLTCTLRDGHSSSIAKTLHPCSQASVPQADTCLCGPSPTHHRGRSPAHGNSQHPPPLPRAACPSPRLSGVPGTAGMAPTRKNHHSRRIASAADASSAVQMMIKCYCVRESSKEGLISFIVRKGSTGPPAPNSKAGLTQCMLGRCLGLIWEKMTDTEVPALDPHRP